MNGSPWTFHPHPAAWAVVVALAAAYALVVRRPGNQATSRQMLSFGGGLVLLAVALGWPLADLAAHWSLTALVVQRLLLTLGVPPLLVLGTPQPVVSLITRPAPIDGLLRRCSRPVVAIVVVTVVAVGTLSVAAVEWQASSIIGRVALDVVLLAAGLVLWAPVLQRLPGTERPSALGRAAYLVVQSIVPSFLAVVWIFARHPLYPPYAHARVFGLRPETDQQLAGFVAKLGTIAVLWTVAFVVINRAPHGTDDQGEEEPLRWSDVERQLERAERSQRRHGEPTEPGP